MIRLYAKYALSAAFALFCTSIIAQNTVTWVGGTPGKETKWEEPKNWDTNRVPDDFSNVVIPDVSSTTFALPVISEGTVEVNAIQIHTQSKVIVKEILLYNHGSKEGDFKIKYSGDKGISIIPSSGKVPPSSAQVIKVSYQCSANDLLQSFVLYRRLSGL